VNPSLSPSAPIFSPKPARKGFAIDSRYVAPMFITLILLVANYQFRVLESFDRTALAILTAIGTEIVLSMLLRGKFPHLASAYVSGISAGILVRSPEYWPYALCAAIAITSKYVLCIKGRHLWNPTNFAISMLLIVAPFAVSTLSVQWDNRPWAMFVIWSLGAFIVSKLKRLHICATYIACFVALALVRSLITGHTFESEVSPITGPMYQLFIFFMITDPKTTVGSKRAQCFVVAMVAVAECILRLNQNVHAPYYALFTVGPIANLIDIWLTERRKNALSKAQIEAPGAPVTV
jgi:Na+-translocating ferredoxin:NAD+ oxidoreductase RnfD subunit